MIAVDDPAFTFFVGLCLICRLRTQLLRAEADSLPEILKDMAFSSQEEDTDAVLNNALVLYRLTPRCFIRNLRLCCVASAELAPHPGVVKHSLEEGLVPELDRTMAAQAARSTLMLSPQELVASLSPFLTKSSDPSQTQPAYFLIDIRSSEDAELTGAGSLPKAMQLEPDLLSTPDALDIWLQHFDGVKGVPICIVDLPPVRSEASLWKRILLGEGDGLQFPNVIFEELKSESTSSFPLLDALASRLQSKPSSSSQQSDPTSMSEEEELSRREDEVRHSSQLARALHRAGFSRVSVLEGGFPALLDQLSLTRGTVEPLIIGHDPEKWEAFLHQTGRWEEKKNKLLKEKKRVAQRRQRRPIGTDGERLDAEGEVSDEEESNCMEGPYSTENPSSVKKSPSTPQSRPRRVQDLSRMRRLEIGHRAAVRRGHLNMARSILTLVRDLDEERRLKELMRQDQGDTTEEIGSVEGEDRERQKVVSLFSSLPSLSSLSSQFLNSTGSGEEKGGNLRKKERLGSLGRYFRRLLAEEEGEKGQKEGEREEVGSIDNTHDTESPPPTSTLIQPSIILPMRAINEDDFFASSDSDSDEET